MSSYTAQVYGNPIAKGSMKCIGGRGKVKHQLVDTKVKTLKPWAETLTKATKAVAAIIPNAPLTGPVLIEATFTLPRPKTVKRAWPIGRGDGDTDKLVRALLDALTEGGVWGDDSQCVGGATWKAYPGSDLVGNALDRPGVWFKVTPLEAQEVSQ